MTNWRASLDGVAPRAVRNATSRPRVVARTSTRFATLAAARTSTRTTAAANTPSAGRTEPKITDISGSTCAPRALLSAGYSRSSAAITAAISSWADLAVTACARRPMTSRGWVRARQGRGIQRQRHPCVHAAPRIAIGKPAAVVGRQQPLQHADVRRLGKHADHRPRPIVEPNGTSDNRAVAMEQAAPQPIGDEHDVVAAARDARLPRTARPTVGRTPSNSKTPGVTESAARRIGSPRGGRQVELVGDDRAKPLDPVARAFRSRGNPAARQAPRNVLLSRSVSQTATSRSGCGYGTGFSSTASITLKIAVTAPRPIASVRMAGSANPGLRRRSRAAYRTSWLIPPNGELAGAGTGGAGGRDRAGYERAKPRRRVCAPSPSSART